MNNSWANFCVNFFNSSSSRIIFCFPCSKKGFPKCLNSQDLFPGVLWSLPVNDLELTESFWEESSTSLKVLGLILILIFNFFYSPRVVSILSFFFLSNAELMQVTDILLKFFLYFWLVWLFPCLATFLPEGSYIFPLILLKLTFLYLVVRLTFSLFSSLSSFLCVLFWLEQKVYNLLLAYPSAKELSPFWWLILALVLGLAFLLLMTAARGLFFLLKKNVLLLISWSNR